MDPSFRWDDGSSRFLLIAGWLLEELAIAEALGFAGTAYA